MKTRTKESKRRLHSLILLTAFTAVLLIVSTYAWFTTQKNVNISNLRGKVEVAEGLEISLDAKTWVQKIDLGAANTSLTTAAGEDGIVYGPYKNISNGADAQTYSHNNIVPTEFLPVSTSGETVAAYTTTAYSNSLLMLNGKYAGTQLEGIVQANDTVANEQAAGYYAFDLFVKNSSRTGISSNVLQLNGDSSAWVLPEDEPIVIGANTSNETTYVGNSDSGLQNTIRVAFARYGVGDTSDPTKVIDATADQYTVLQKTYGQTIDDVCIWEPNSNTHVSYITTNVKPYFDLASSTHTYLDSTTNDPFFTHTLLGAAKGETILNVFDWFGTNSSIMKQTPTLQTETPADGDTDAKIGKIQDMTSISSTITDGAISTEKTLTIPGNSITKFRIYVYIEGQDPDCVNFASYGGGIEVNIGLTKDAEDDAVYVPDNSTNTTTNTGA